MDSQYTRFIHDGIASIPFGTLEIKENAFAECEELVGVVIPNSVVRIGISAFANCYNLINVEIPNSVMEINAQAFCGSGIERIELPNSVTNIGENAFRDTRIKHFHVPSGVRIIKEGTFAGCEGLLSVSLPAEIDCIRDHAFDGCKSLTDLEIPDSVRSIGQFAFSGCHSLNTLHLSRRLSSIGSYAFQRCSNIEHISNSSVCYSAKGNCIIQGGNLLFGGKNSYIPSDAGVRVIKQQAFFWSNIDHVVIPNGVKTIEADAFICCKNLKQIKLPFSLESIEGNPFSFCPNLESITVDTHFAYSSYTSENNCILDINKTTLLVGCNTSFIPPTVTKIAGQAFRGSGIESICILNGVKAIGPEAFYDCKRLSHVRLPNTLMEFGLNCFSGCSTLKEIEILIEHPSRIPHWDKYHFFEGIDLSRIILYVPVGAGYEYRNDSVFRDCKDIRPVLREEDNSRKANNDNNENITDLLFSGPYSDDLPF